MADGCCGGSSCEPAVLDLDGQRGRAATGKATHESVQEYYGRVLKTKDDLKTGACCSPDAAPAWQRETLGQIASEIHEKFYGCGSPIPPALEGCTVLDLGCGTGRDSYVCSKLVGESGSVIGVDMTDEQLEVALKYRESQAEAFGLSAPNTDFRKGYIEDLAAAGIEDNTIDVVISNCVLNLSPDKPAVFREIFRVLKPGGELYFSDVFADRRISQDLQDDPVLRGECLGGAMYTEDFRRMLLNLGIRFYSVVSSRPFEVTDPEVHDKIGGVHFTSETIRAFKLYDFEDRCEDFGQVAWYQGTIPHHPHEFPFDAEHLYETGRPVPVCGNSAAILTSTRFAPHFKVAGDRSHHLGVMESCETVIRAASDCCDSSADGGCCC